MEKFEHTTSADIVKDNIKNLKTLFPEAFTEGKIDFEVLKQMLGGEVEEREEKYGLNWYGKRLARQIALTPSTGTLRPCPGEGVDEDTTKNIMIEGDNLEVLKLLQKSYSGKVKLIYIDPPYNTGRDFVYPDNFKDGVKNYLELTGQIEGGMKVTSNPESSGRFHTDWINMIYPRLIMARNLLREDGVLFISIGESELHNLIYICGEVFGSESLLGIACRVAKKSNNKGDFWAPNFDYIVTCGRNKECTAPFSGGINFQAYDLVEEEGPRKGEKYQLIRLYMSTIENQNPDQRYWIDCPDGSKVIPPGRTFPPERPLLGDGIWRWSKATFEEQKDRIVVKRVRSSNLLNEQKEPASWNVFTKTYLNDVIANATSKPNNLIEEYINQIGSHEMTALGIPFDYPKPSLLIKYLIEISQTKKDDLILDFFAGSGTTAHAVMAQNATDNGDRKYILVQLPEPLDPENADQKTAANFCDSLGKPRTIAELTKERLRRAGQKIKSENPMFSGDTGFRVFKLDTSNIHTWEVDKNNLDRTLEDAMVHIKKDRSEEDILIELLLKLGLDLTVPIESKSIANKKVYSVGLGALIVCLDQSIKVTEVESLALGIIEWHKNIASESESSLVFRDSAFENDIAKTNLTAILEQYGLTNIRSL